VNKHLIPLWIDKKQKEPKRVTELRDNGLWACHYAEEFTLWRICPLVHQDKLEYECPRQANPSREPADGKFFKFSFFR
jgi:hypothetical protein